MAYNLLGFNVIQGTAAAETLNGTLLRDAIYGNGGADVLNGGLGSDILFGGTSGGVQFVYSVDSTWLPGFRATNSGDPSGAGASTSFDLSGYGQSQDVFVGSGANNTLVMADGKNALFLEDTLSLGADTVRLVNIQTIQLGTGGQIIDLSSTTKSYGNVSVIGNTGNDVIISNAGADTLSGGEGNDYIWGGSGNDTINGGAGTDTLLGATGDDTLDGGTGADSMNGGAGNDTFYVDIAGDTVVEASGQGTDRVFTTITHTLATNVETLTLMGAVAINGTGNTLDNTINGNTADNRLDGGTGRDTLAGGLGNDTYVVDNIGDVLSELASQGTDTVLSSVTYTLAANVENLTLTGTGALDGTGNTLDNVITGNSASNTLTGGDGNDTLDGGGARDVLVGGLGNDTYIADNAAEVTTELAGQGTDLVRASVTHTLQANIENLTLTGASAINGTGNDLNNIIIGNTAANTLNGGLGNDYLDGGTGADTMIGGAGGDAYVVDNASDATTEVAGGGTDLVLSSVTHTLAGSVENLTLTGAATTNGTGNTMANLITGNAANNTLSGLDGDDKINAGLGNDTLNGGNGNDQMFGEDGNDVLFGNEGNDLLNGGFGLDTIRGGNGNDGIFGGGSNDILNGEAGNDNIYGDNGNDVIMGGAGNDLLAGGQLKNGFSLGNDTFAWVRADVVNTAGAKQGFDHVVDFGAGDKIDFSGLSLTAGPIANVVKVVDTAAGTVISANFGGSVGFVDVVVLDSVHHMTLNDMVVDHAIVV